MNRWSDGAGSMARCFGSSVVRAMVAVIFSFLLGVFRPEETVR